MSDGARLPRDLVLPVAKDLVEYMRPYCERVEIAGSLRREKPDVGDIEIVAVPKFIEVKQATLFPGDTTDETDRVNTLWQWTDTAMCFKSKVKGGDRYRQLLLHHPDSLCDGIKVDIFTAAPGTYGIIFLIRTGSAAFSHSMMKALNEQGYTSHRGMVRRRRDSYPIKTPEERDVFDLAAMPWVEPKMR